MSFIPQAASAARRERRRLLRAAAAIGAGAALTALAAAEPAASTRDAALSSHFPFGPAVPPRSIPAWPVLTHLSVQTDLAALLRGRTTALQLMFTGCSATCPIQGALFAQAQHELLAQGVAAQLVSLSIDPLGDTPAALDGWLRQFSAAPGWLAAVPRLGDVDRIVDVLGSGGEPRPKGSSDPHTGQVYIVDRRGELVYRTPSMPPVRQIIAILRLVAERA